MVPTSLVHAHDDDDRLNEEHRQPDDGRVARWVGDHRKPTGNDSVRPYDPSQPLAGVGRRP